MRFSMKRTNVRLTKCVRNAVTVALAFANLAPQASAITPENALSQMSMNSRAALVKLVQSKYGATAIAQRIDLAGQKFEARVADQNEVTSTYASLAKLVLTKNAAVNDDEKLMLVSQVVSQAADPQGVNQGHHNTCAIAAFESRTYSIHPSVAAQLVQSIAETGSYLLPEGSSIELRADNLRPDADALEGAAVSRSYASQLFQIAVANIFWQTQEKDPRGIACGKGRVRYYQTQPKFGDDTGERLQIVWGGGVIESVIDDQAKPVHDPCFSLREVQRVSHLLIPGDQDLFVIASDKFDKHQKYVGVRSVDELRNKLTRLKQSNKLPLVAAVNSRQGWFAREPQFHQLNDDWIAIGHSAKQQRLQASKNQGLHAVCITDYDPQSDKVSIDNFWGPAADHIGDNAVPVTDLFQAIANAN